MDENFNVNFDKEAIIQSMVDKFIDNTLRLLVPDDDSKALVTNLYKVLRKNDIDSAKSTYIIADFIESFKE